MTQGPTRISVADRSAIEEFLAGLSGSVCWRVERSYGDALNLHFGGRNLGPTVFHPRLGEWRYEYGDWHVASEGADWEAMSPGTAGAFATSREPVDEADPKLKRIEGRTIVRTIVSDTLSLELHFDEGLALVLIPSDCSEGLPHWKVFRPGNQVLVVGPGLVHTVKRSDVPA